MDENLLTKVDEWLRLDKNDESRNIIESMRDKKQWNELREIMLNRMTFGTAGLRAKMGPGYSQMNDLTIIQTTQGLLKYSNSHFRDLKSRGIAVGYDMRHNSKRWAEYVANIFTNFGCPVYLFERVGPTPLLAYAIGHYKCALGVMITASHNPKQDNGYKVYWSNGSQIISPHDKGISDSILANLQPFEDSWLTDVYSRPLCKRALADILPSYCQQQKEKLCFTYEKNCVSQMAFIYTAMHGVGWEAVQNIVQEFGFKPLIPVTEQVHPDPEISTVKYPNPEEGRSALNLACETADKANCTIVLANDPDADRLAVAEKQPSGEWNIFSGNELGALIGWWLWKNWRQRNPNADASKVAMLSSTVSSKILETVASKEGFLFEETLTGFKWMGNKAHELAKQGISTIFAFEEAIGFMCGDLVSDKDGVGALAVMMELTNFAYANTGSLSKQLEEIYTEYGYHISNNGYYFCYCPMTLESMFHRLRHWTGESTTTAYPPACGAFRIVGIRDLTTGYDDAYEDKQARLPVSRSSHNITFQFENGATMTIRTSGTEPKIKFYSELRGKPNDKSSWKRLRTELQELVDCMLREFYQPEKNGFTSPSV